MAIVKNNKFLDGTSGKIGDSVVRQDSQSLYHTAFRDSARPPVIDSSAPK